MPRTQAYRMKDHHNANMVQMAPPVALETGVPHFMERAIVFLADLLENPNAAFSRPVLASIERCLKDMASARTNDNRVPNSLDTDFILPAQNADAFDVEEVLWELNQARKCFA